MLLTPALFLRHDIPLDGGLRHLEMSTTWSVTVMSSGEFRWQNRDSVYAAVALVYFANPLKRTACVNGMASPFQQLVPGFSHLSADDVPFST